MGLVFDTVEVVRILRAVKSLRPVLSKSGLATGGCACPAQFSWRWLLTRGALPTVNACHGMMILAAS